MAVDFLFWTLMLYFFFFVLVFSCCLFCHTPIFMFVSLVLVTSTSVVSFVGHLSFCFQTRVPLLTNPRLVIALSKAILATLERADKPQAENGSLLPILNMHWNASLTSTRRWNIPPILFRLNYRVDYIPSVVCTIFTTCSIFYSSVTQHHIEMSVLIVLYT